jgi:LmbE family N-acetylglucosaminyl deacetylase
VNGAGLHVLAIGAHPDDIELGCGAALLAHRRAGHAVTMLVMTAGLGPAEQRARPDEQEEASALLQAGLAWGGFEDGRVPFDGPAVRIIEDTITRIGAEVIYTHAAGDSHQDHRAVAAATAAAARRTQRVLCYESPTSLRFSPTHFVDVGGLVEGKLGLIRAHLSQVMKNGLVDLEAVEAQARFRGFQARVRYAEAFEATRFVWDIAHFAQAADQVGARNGEEGALSKEIAR